MKTGNEPDAQESRDEAAGALALYDYFARLFLNPIEVPGFSYVADLQERTSHIFESTHAEGDITLQGLSIWLVEVAALRNREENGHDARAALEEEQQLLAADRTKLFRGTSAAGPLPPYEEYYANTQQDGSVSTPASEAYRRAGVHADETCKERDNYAGVELAFLAHLAQRELTALDQEDFAAANEAHEVREAFERDHLPWMSAYAQAALPHARTPFWKGALTLLGALTE